MSWFAFVFKTGNGVVSWIDFNAGDGNVQDSGLGLSPVLDGKKD